MEFKRNLSAWLKRWGFVAMVYLATGAPVFAQAGAAGGLASQSGTVANAAGNVVRTISGSSSLSMVQNVNGTAVEVLDSTAQGALDSLMNRAVSAGVIDGASAGVATIADTVAIDGIGGGVAVSIAEAVGADAVGAAAVACIASVVCGAAVAAGAIGIAALMDQAKVKSGCGKSGGPCADMGGDLSPQTTWCADFHDGGDHCGYSSASQACNASFPYWWSSDGNSSGGANAQNACVVITDSGGHYTYTYAGTETAPGCPQVNGINVPPFKNPDGSTMCPTNMGNTTDDPVKVAKAIAQAAKADPQNAATGVTQILDGGGSIDVIPTAITGPSSVDGGSQTTSTTNPDGTSTATTNATKYDLNYRPDATGIDITTDTTTTVTNKDADGQVTGTKTTTTSTGGNTGNTGNTGTGTGTGTGGNGDVQLEDPCALHPGILACDLVGTPPTDAPTWSNKDITFAPEDLGLPSGCPAPRTFTVRSINFVLNYQPACDVAPMISPALIAFASLGCLLWVIAQVKG